MRPIRTGIHPWIAAVGYFGRPSILPDPSDVRSLVFLCCSFAVAPITAQNTIGLVNYSADMADGFMLIYPHDSALFLLNRLRPVEHLAGYIVRPGTVPG
ncbi:MAG: hypothetical protein IPI07_03265 [Flavobacteriales bacterium]|nr:hypothetical protein [Flavobacteriales bacterium]